MPDPSPQPDKNGLDAFLKSHPWPPDWAALGETLEWFWVFELRTPPERLWERLSDTSAFNARLGLPEMTFKERDGNLRGRSKNLGMTQEWQEVPWEWAWGQGLSNARIYSRGLAKLVRSRYELEASGSGGTRLKVYFGWIPRSWLGGFLLRASTRWMRDSYARVLAEMDEEISGDKSPAAPEAALSREQAQRIKTAAEALQTLGVEHSLYKRLETLLIKGADEDLARIRPKNLAARWHVKLASLIHLLLLATRQGLLRLTWDVVCPHCRGVRSEANSLGSLPQRGSCQSCGIDFDATDHGNLDVSFHVHPSLRQATPRLFCAAEPGRKPHIMLQASLAPGERRQVRLSLPAGRYRARSAGPLARPAPLNVAAGAPRSGTWILPDGAPPAGLGRDSLLELVNSDSVPRVFVLEQWESDRQALRPGELFNFQDFRDMFSEEGVATGVKLDVGHQCLLFTDLVGSTKFYLAEGDSVAFAHVREHFMRIYEAVKIEDGAVVKTIGDACMVAFNDPHQAFRAALDIQRRFPEGGLRVRVTLHHGPCLAVNLNSHIDYFGSTVNYAAKMQSAAGAGEVVFSDEIASQAGVREAIAKDGLLPEAFSFGHSWDQGASPCFRLKVS